MLIGGLLVTTCDYFVHIDNDSPGTDSINVEAYSTGTSRMRVSHFVDGLDVTPQVTGGGYTFSDLAPHARVSLVVRIHVGPRALRNSVKRSIVRVHSVANATHVDLMRAIAAR